MSSPSSKSATTGSDGSQFVEPNPDAFNTYQREIYGSFRPPAFSTNPLVWESLARSKVPASNFGYVHGSASLARTADANVQAFDRYRLRPSMLVDATRRDLSVELFGKKYASPILAAPVGVQKIMHHDAEEATAKACQELKIPMILSTAATRTIEQVAAANGDGDRWYQLYWPRPKSEEITISLLNRAKAQGYSVLVVTLDTFLLAWRPTDLDESYLPFLWGDGCQIGFSDPVFNRLYAEQIAEESKNTSLSTKLGTLYGLLTRPGSVYGAAKLLFNAGTIRKSQAWLEVLNSGTYREWKHLEILKKHWDGPIVLKGIQTVQDAKKAIEYGMDGIIVSNHGGRQVDGAIASLDALEEITADPTVKGSNLTILFDSGIRTGSDVLKAIALGAKAVLIGRPYMYGLAIDGREGAKHVFKCLLAETDNMLANCGKTSLSQLSRDDLQIRERAKL